jgi:hypothetical protein
MLLELFRLLPDFLLIRSNALIRDGNYEQVKTVSKGSMEIYFFSSYSGARRGRRREGGSLSGSISTLPPRWAPSANRGDSDLMMPEKATKPTTP